MVDDVWHLSDRDIERLNDGRVLLSMSGGKDSTACALLLERHGVSFEPIFMDTGWEHPVLYQYLSDVLEPRFGKITHLKSKKYPAGMPEMIKKKGAFPSRVMRFCTAELKSKPFIEHVLGLDDHVINVIGIRRQESAARLNADRWQDDALADCEVFRPLVDHTFDDVIAMHSESGIAPNPLYLQGASRVGCFPCIYSRKSEIDQVARLWPERIQQIEDLEIELSDAAQKKWDKDPEFRKKIRHKVIRRLAYVRTLEPAGVDWQQFKAFDSGTGTIDGGLAQLYADEYANVSKAENHDPEYLAEKKRKLSRTFFHTRTDGGVRSVVEWAETDRGGRQLKLFDMTARDGCTRWGMCESPLADSELVKIRDPDS